MKNFYLYRASLNDNKSNIIVCFYSGKNLCIETFYNEVVDQFKSSIFSKDIIFITPSFNKKDITVKLLNHEVQEILRNRINSFQELNFHTCFIKRNGQFELKIFDQSSAILSKEEIKKILEIGLFNIIETRNLVLKAHSNIHFIKPSGKHTEKFIDVRNILESSAEISFIATNILSLVPQKIERIYVDTSGIYPLAFELINLIRSFDSSIDVIPIDSFGSYGRYKEYKFRSNKETLVLISASTSNELYDELNRPEVLELANFITIVMTQRNNTSQKVLIEFEKYRDNYKGTCTFEEFSSYSEKACPMCKEKSSVPVALGKDRFDVSAPRTEIYLPVAVDSDKQLRSLIHNYKELKIFKCFFDGVEGKKTTTPEYFIDVSKLIKNNVFVKKVTEKFINRHFPLNTDCILACNDQGAKEFATLIQSIVNEKNFDVKIYNGEISADVEDNKGIIVVAGSLESGKSLLNISRALRRFPSCPITYVIGFAKYNSEKEFEKLKKDLSYSTGPSGHHSVHVIEKILLPINEHDEITWEKEITLLTLISAQYKQGEPLKEIIDKRIHLLKTAKSIEVKGLGEALFINTVCTAPLILGETFAFWDKDDNKERYSHQATVYFTISSILQKLRTEINKDGIKPLGDGYIIRQLDPLLFDRFNEGIIQASVLRAAKCKELDYSGNDSQSKIIGSLIDRMLRHPNAPESSGLAEFLLALCLGKLQIKEKHFPDFESHSLNENNHPMAWILAERLRKKSSDDVLDSTLPM